MYFARGRGCRITDVDGHEYIDFLMAFGAFLLGYADPEVDAAARQELEQGSLLSMNRPQHVLFAEALVERFAGADMAVLLKTGSEATTAALRIARRATGRSLVARAGYHGWHDWCLPLDPSVPAGLDAQVSRVRPATIPGRSSSAFDVHPGEIAAVILAPEMVLPPRQEIFQAIQDVTHRRGALFVLDEVKTAFRQRRGPSRPGSGSRPTHHREQGADQRLADSPVVGRRRRHARAAGSISRDVPRRHRREAAALTTLRLVEERPRRDHVWALGQRLIDGLNAIARDLDVPAWTTASPSTTDAVLRFEHPHTETNDALRTAFYEAILERGVSCILGICGHQLRHQGSTSTPLEHARASAIRSRARNAAGHERALGRRNRRPSAHRRPLPARRGSAPSS